MPRIPVYQQQVGKQQVRVQPANVQIQPTQAQFGGAEAGALQNIGGTISKIGEVLAHKKQRDNKQKALDVDTQFNVDFQNMLYSNNTEEVTGSNGEIVQRPIGLINRKLRQANGVSLDYEKQFQILKQQYLKDQDPGVSQILNNMFDRTYINNRNNIIKHETIQNNADKELSLNANLASMREQAIMNPTADNTKSVIESGRGNILVNNQGVYDQKYTDLKMQEFSDDVVTGTVGNLLSANNYEQASIVLKENKKYISKAVYSASKDKINEVKVADQQLDYNNDLFSSYGFDEQSAYKDIQDNKSLDNKQKEKQNSSYRGYINRQKQVRNSTENNITNSVITGAETLFNEEGISGYEEATKLVNNSELDYTQRQSLQGVVDGMFSAKVIKTTPIEVWNNLLDDMESGEVSDRDELMKKYGDKLSYGDLKSASRTLTVSNSTNEYNKFSLTSTANKLFKESDLSPEDQSRAWDYNAARMQDESKKLGRNLTNEEQSIILQDSLTKVVIEKRKLLGIDFLRSDYEVEKYKTSYNSIWSPELDAYVWKDKYGNIHKADEGDLRE